MLTIERATLQAIDELAADLHPDDAAELLATGLDVRAGVPTTCQALRWDGRLVALFGLEGNPLAEGAGVPWMLCTQALALVPPRRMAETSRRVCSEWMAQRAELTNMVHRQNARAIRFVEWLGFHVKREPFGPGGAFYLFTWRRGHV